MWAFAGLHLAVGGGIDGEVGLDRVVVLETERLALRQLTEADAAFMLALLNDPAFVRFIGDRGVRTLDEARGYLASGTVASYARNGFGLYLVERKPEGTAVGICGLVKRDGLDDVDLGYAFLPAFRGRGYALEAAAAVLAHARQALGLKRIVAVVSPGNERSIRLLERLGLRFERMVQLPGDDDAIKLFGPSEPIVPPFTV
ncbi:MAG: GNAT family N-acetyltransferase [Anaerolineales bacterium]|nr:GNAT family N-acetyltransferase [Anaerolineales bacterium]